MEIGRRLSRPKCNAHQLPPLEPLVLKREEFQRFPSTFKLLFVLCFFFFSLFLAYCSRDACARAVVRRRGNLGAVDNDAERQQHSDV